LLQETLDESTLFFLVVGAVIIFSLIVAKVLAKRGIPQVLGLIFGGIVLLALTFLTTFPSPPTPELYYVITTGTLGFQSSWIVSFQEEIIIFRECRKENKYIQELTFSYDNSRGLTSL